ncbi:MAG: metalloregulator ArsR/SmtB family transcription factor [Hyphomicrobiaceae bacterium]|nr:metalloregulator ArsR/SmtB family transcription factor [Hyphomicrobiaceae bacterium]
MRLRFLLWLAACDVISANLDSHAFLTALKAAGEPTRLRILRLLAQGEMTVKDLTTILAQSQPRLSRHLKLLHEAGMLDRHREGSWVFFRLADDNAAGTLARGLLNFLDHADPVFRRDDEHAAHLIAGRVQAAQDFFAAHAADWHRLRSLYVDEAEVERQMRDVLTGLQIDLLVDLGTGTGRMLDLFGDLYSRGLGIDTNQAMLAYARANLDATGRRNAHVRQGDLHNLAINDGAASVCVMHQVLHFMADPAKALAEAARLIEPGGHLLLVDFAPHDLEFLRDQHAHQRLGFSDGQVRNWLAECGLDIVTHRELRPAEPAREGKLTVMLWLARRPELDDTHTTRRPALSEEAVH